MDQAKLYKSDQGPKTKTKSAARQIKLKQQYQDIVIWGHYKGG